jgi:hypothetical protein
VAASEQAVQILQFAYSGPQNCSACHSNRFADRYLHHNPSRPEGKRRQKRIIQTRLLNVMYERSDSPALC